MKPEAYSPGHNSYMPTIFAEDPRSGDEYRQQIDARGQRADAHLATSGAGTLARELEIVESRPASPRATTNYSPSFLARVKNFVMIRFEAAVSRFPKAGYFLASREIRKNLAKEGAVTYEWTQATRRIRDLTRESTDRLVSDVALMERIDAAQDGFDDDGSNKIAYFSGLCEHINRRRSFWMKDTIQTVCLNDEPLMIERLLFTVVSNTDCDIGTEAWISCVQKGFAQLARVLGRDPAELMDEFDSIKGRLSHFDTHRALEGGLLLFSMES